MRFHPESLYLIDSLHNQFFRNSLKYAKKTPINQCLLFYLYSQNLGLFSVKESLTTAHTLIP